jgi:septal ring factor EnvC (AmiA/AmiB activator)
MRKSLLLLLFPLCLVSCGGGTSQDDYDALQAKYNQLEKEANDCKSQLSSCQSELADYKEKCEDLQEQIENQSSSNDVPTRVIERTVVGSNAKQILVIAKNDVKNLYNDVLYGNVNGTDDLLKRLEIILNDMDY